MSSNIRAGAVATLAAATLMVPAAAYADPPESAGVVERETTLSAWLFNGDGLQVVTGPALSAESCQMTGWKEPVATVVDTPSGAVLTRYAHTDDVWVFDDRGFTDPLDWIIDTCSALFAGEPAPEPLAQGAGEVKVNSRVDAGGVTHTRMVVTARVTTSDGREVHLTAHGVDGVSPDFVNYGG